MQNLLNAIDKFKADLIRWIVGVAIVETLAIGGMILMLIPVGKLKLQKGAASIIWGYFFGIFKKPIFETK
jgi:uncharacterized membrane protein